MKDLNVTPKTIKFLEENIGEKHHDIGFGSDFLDVTPKAQATIEKISWILSEFKMYTSEDTINEGATYRMAGSIFKSYYLVRD